VNRNPSSSKGDQAAIAPSRRGSCATTSSATTSSSTCLARRRRSPGAGRSSPQPSTTTQCNPDPTATKATINFDDSANGLTFALPLACSSATFAWSGAVFPGTYRISVSGASGYSNLPTEGFWVTHA
jgi:hypothetical protein